MMEKKDKEELEYLKEKYAKNEKILIKAYNKIKQKEKELEEINEDLRTSEEELRSSNEMIREINLELIKKNEIINIKNEKLKTTLNELKETQAQLFQSEKMASLGILTAGVAHEINNPLNFIMSSYEILKERCSEVADNKEAYIIKRSLENLYTGIERTVAIVKSLNEFSRDNKAKDERCNILQIIDNCLVMLNNQLKDRVSVKKLYAIENTAFVKGNSGQLHQAFLNILSNAAQAIQNKGIITIRIARKEEELHIEIVDTGVGISTEGLKHVMDPFYTTKDPGRGTGLGLSITYIIINEHNGKLEIKSEMDKGTAVSMVLPLCN